MYNYYINDVIEQTISFINLSNNDNINNIMGNSNTRNIVEKEDLAKLEDDVKIESDYLDYLFHYNK